MQAQNMHASLSVPQHLPKDADFMHWSIQAEKAKHMF